VKEERTANFCLKQQSFGDWQAKKRNLPAFNVIEQLLHPNFHFGHHAEVLFPLNSARS